jgi:UDP-N-acetyl-D-glucosamine dehydrogenase
MCHRLGIDVWEVIEAAKTKPYGFQAFYPGPGLGGHCIPIDPFYLAWKVRLYGFEPRFIDLAGQVNGAMPEHVVALVADLLNDMEKPLRGSRIHLLGAAYKPDVSDVRESPAITIMELLSAKGARVSFSDPHVGSVRLGDGREVREVPLDAYPLEEADCVVIITDHSAFPWAEVVRRSRVILDTRNALRKFREPHIHRL